MIINRSSNCPYCGDDHTNSCYITYNDGDYCFSCGKGSKKSASFYAYKPQITVKSKTYIPHYSFNISDFSLQALKWLYNFYLDDKDIKKAGIAFCAKAEKINESLLFPVVKTSNVITEFQRRFFPKGFYSSQHIKEYVFLIKSNKPHVVLVEDYISALRVSKYCDVICLFGTKLTQHITNYVIANYSSVLIWLDPDAPGQNSASDILKILTKEYTKFIQKYPLKNNNDITINNIVSQSQPKELSPSKLKSYIS